MNKVWSTAFLVMGINIGLLLLSFAAPGAGIVMGVLGLIAELVIGIVLASNKEKESIQKGQGILLGLGLFILIGASVCGLILMSISIGH